MENKVFKIARTFNAKRQDVWLAITDKDLMKQWYFNLPEFKAEAGFTFEFTGGEEGGKQFLHRCVITEVVIEKKLTYTWCYVGYAGVSYVTFELFDEGENTRLELTHAGIETFPADVAAFTYHNFEAGWNQIINSSLKDFLEKNKS